MGGERRPALDASRKLPVIVEHFGPPMDCFDVVGAFLATALWAENRDDCTLFDRRDGDRIA
jgi:hypothetical protein